MLLYTVCSFDNLRPVKSLTHHPVYSLTNSLYKRYRGRDNDFIAKASGAGGEVAGTPACILSP